MAQYLVLIYGDEQQWEEGGKPLQDKTMEGHMKFSEKHKAAVMGGSALQFTSTATSLRDDGTGNFSITDGPFVETKEALGGYYVIEAADLDAAIAISKDIPAPNGGLEIRPLWVFD